MPTSPKLFKTEDRSKDNKSTDNKSKDNKSTDDSNIKRCQEALAAAKLNLEKHPEYKLIKIFGIDLLKGQNDLNPDFLKVCKAGLNSVSRDYEMEQRIATNKGKRINTNDMGGLIMYLPSETIQQKIKQFGIKVGNDTTNVYPMNSESILPLTTKIIGADGVEISVVCRLQSGAQNTYELTSPDGTKCFGHIWFGGAEYNKIYPDNLYINHMANHNESFKHVGTALYEIALRISLSKGHQGKVTLDAGYSSHVFHYKFGCRFKNPSSLSMIDADQFNELTQLINKYEKLQDEYDKIKSKSSSAAGDTATASKLG